MQLHWNTSLVYYDLDSNSIIWEIHLNTDVDFNLILHVLVQGWIKHWAIPKVEHII